MSERPEMAKRLGLARELAGLAYRQRLILQASDALRLGFEADAVIVDDERERYLDALRRVNAEDEHVASLIETAVVNYGLLREPCAGTQRAADGARALMQDRVLSLYERFQAAFVLRHAQVDGARILRKCMQVAPKDVKDALLPIEGVMTTLSRQQEEVSWLLDELAVRTIMGDDVNVGFFAKAREAATAMADSLRAKATTPSEDMSVLDVLCADHSKLKTLFRELEKAKNPSARPALFEQLRIDLVSHSRAEEAVVYRYFAVQGLHDELVDSYEDHASLREKLEALSRENPLSEEFLADLESLKELVERHVDEEEGRIFRAFKRKADQGELVELSRRFVRVKEEVQEELNPGWAGAVRGEPPPPPP